MTAKPLHVDVFEPTKMKTSSSKNSLENTDAPVNNCTDSPTVGVHNPHSTADLSSIAAAATTADGSLSQRLKKSSFQITRIVQADTTGDSADDIDDVTSADDLGSSLDGTRYTNANADAQSMDTTHSPSSVEEAESLTACQKHLFPNSSSHLVRTQPSDINSRFKIVKIESNRPLRRGRWVCLEFVDPPHLSAPPEKVAKCSGGAESIYYVQVEKEDPSNNPFAAAAIVYSDGHPSLEPNPLPFTEGGMCPSSCSIAAVSILQSDRRRLDPSNGSPSLSSEQVDPELAGSVDRNPPPYAVRSLMSNSFRHDDHDRGALVNGVSSASDEMFEGVRNEGQRDAVMRMGSEPSFVHSRVSDDVSSPLFAIVPSSNAVYAYGIAENDISGGICALDNKIEQAMDLVKSHLMFAVHEEVELLKEQIKELTIKKGQLEYENKVLRASATQETLEKLHQGGASSALSTTLS